MEIVVGTYEELLLGYVLVKAENEYKLQQSFTNHSHIGCIKCVACQRNLLVSGSTDESIRIFDLKKRRELGTLHQHSGTVTSLEFFAKSHLFSTSEDGLLCVWKVAGWEAIRTFKGHKGGVNCVSVHPSGKLAITVSRDRTLRLWNLVDGRPAFTSNIKNDAEIVVWSPDGNVYVVSWNTTISVHRVEEGKIQASFDTSKRVNAVVFIQTNAIAYAGDGGDVYFHDILEGKQLHQLSTGTNRIRGLAVCPSHEDPSNPQELWLSAASSDGHIRVYRISLSKDKIESELLTSHNTTFRLTCITVTKPDVEPTEETLPVAKKKKRKAREPHEPLQKKLKTDDDHIDSTQSSLTESETKAVCLTRQKKKRGKRKIQEGKDKKLKAPNKEKKKKKPTTENVASENAASTVQEKKQKKPTSENAASTVREQKKKKPTSENAASTVQEQKKKKPTSENAASTVQEQKKKKPTSENAASTVREQKKKKPTSENTASTVQEQKKKKVHFGEVRVREIASKRQLVSWNEQHQLGKMMQKTKGAKLTKLSKSDRLKQKRLNKKLKRQQKLAKRQ